MQKNQTNFQDLSFYQPGQRNINQRKNSNDNNINGTKRNLGSAHDIHTQKENLQNTDGFIGITTPSQKNIASKSNKITKPVINQRESIDNNYQSALLTRFLKEPRLPPSTQYSVKNKKRGYQRKTFYRLNQTTNGDQPQPISPKTGPYQDHIVKPNRQKSDRITAAYKHPIISYKQQGEIMRKIFGNDEKYNQIKSLFGQNQLQTPSFISGTGDSRSTDQKVNQQISRTNYDSSSRKKEVNNLNLQMRTRTSPGRGCDDEVPKFPKLNDYSPSNAQVKKPIIPQSQKQSIYIKEEQHYSQSNQKQFNSKPQTDNHPKSQSQVVKDGDQVEKAIFDLQDVKNNYLQEKSEFDNKLKQIQNKTQSNFMNGFELRSNRTTITSGFHFGNSRPFTQGGANLLKNQQLINDEQSLKNDLEQMSKDDLKERLIVAEAVMKKLFQRNKELEDMQIENIGGQRSMSQTQYKPSSPQRIETQTFRQSMYKQDNLGIKSSSQDIEEQTATSQGQINVTTKECESCISLRKEILEKEVQMQDKINYLEQLINNKPTFIKDDQSHQEYMKLRLEETMNEAKRHFQNYISIRNEYNKYLELKVGVVTNNLKGQKLYSDIIQNLKKNLEQQEQQLLEEKQQYLKSIKRFEGAIEKKNETIDKKEKQITQLQEEIDRRKFLEQKVQKYVKSIIRQNDKCKTFIENLKTTSDQMNQQMLNVKINEFLQEINRSNYDENEGESTENENEEDENEDECEEDEDINIKDL